MSTYRMNEYDGNDAPVADAPGTDALPADAPGTDALPADALPADAPVADAPVADALEAYRSHLDGLRFSREAKERMVARLTAEAEAGAAEEAAEGASQNEDAPQSELVPLAPTAAAEPKPARRGRVLLFRRWRLSMAATIAGVAVALGVGGVAYAVTDGFAGLPQLVSQLFGAGEPEVEIVESIGHPVGVAQSSNGVTVSADAIIGDRNNVAVIFSIAKDDGTPFEGIETLPNGLYPMSFSESIDVSSGLFSGGWGATGSSYLYDADPTDNAIQLVETRSFEGDEADGFNLIGRTMTVHLADLTYFGTSDGDEPRVVAPGSWDLSFPLGYEDSSRDLPTGEAFDVNGVSATIDELTISPIALHLRYTADQQVEGTSSESGRQSEHDACVTDTLLGVRVTLNLRDGSSVEVTEGTGGMVSAQGDVTVCETGFFFDRIVDLADVASVTIGGTTIDL